MLHMQPGKAAAEREQGSRLLRPRQADTDELEDIVAGGRPLLAGFRKFLGVEIDVDHADEPPVLIHDREREQAVEREELARFQHRGPARNRDDVRDHDVRDRLVGRARATAAGSGPRPTRRIDSSTT